MCRRCDGGTAGHPTPPAPAAQAQVAGPSCSFVQSRFQIGPYTRSSALQTGCNINALVSRLMTLPCCKQRTRTRKMAERISPTMLPAERSNVHRASVDICSETTSPCLGSCDCLARATKPVNRLRRSRQKLVENPSFAIGLLNGQNNRQRA
jgi:hypothetical protein